MVAPTTIDPIQKGVPKSTGMPCVFIYNKKQAGVAAIFRSLLTTRRRRLRSKLLSSVYDILSITPPKYARGAIRLWYSGESRTRLSRMMRGTILPFR